MERSLKKRTSDARRLRRLDRQRLARPIETRIGDYFAKGDDKLIEYLTPKLDEIRAYFTEKYPLKLMREKAVKMSKIDPADFEALMRWLSGFDYYESADEFAKRAIKPQLISSFEQAARFALGKLGVTVTSFNLRNPNLLDALQERVDLFPSTARVRIESAVSTLTSHFIEQGQAPYNSSFLRQLRADLGYQSNYEAQRFAATETGIITSKANHVSFEKLGVKRKEWLIGIRNVRATHRAVRLYQPVIDFDKKWRVGDGWADHPMDMSLPKEEVINCHCDMAPVLDDNYNIPDRVWSGE
jgi:hypothetical protein